MQSQGLSWRNRTIRKPASPEPASSKSAPLPPSPDPTPSKPAAPQLSPTQSVSTGHREGSPPDVGRRVFTAIANSLAHLRGRLRARAKARVNSLVADIKAIREGTYVGRGELVRKNLSYSEYRQLCEFIENSGDDELRGYFHDKLR